MIQNLLFDVPDDAPTPLVGCDAEVLRVSRMAMATLFEVVTPLGTPKAEFASLAILDQVDELEAQLTVYRPDSEVSLLNERAHAGPVAVAPNLFELLYECALLTRATQGAFDVAMGTLIKAWGFVQRQGRVPTPTERSQAVSQAGTRYLVFDREARTVQYLRPLEINLGSIGKGYALDEAVERVQHRFHLPHGLLQGGRSSVLAWGNAGQGISGWPVGLSHPWQPEISLGTIRLKNQALATSAATYQHFVYNGKKLGHLIDPRTGWPAAELDQVSVIAPNAAHADALSTAFYVLGLEGIRNFCRTHPEVSAIVMKDGQVHCINHPDFIPASTAAVASG
ncbi:MAG: FAD:protein FMN transferase [Zavarzinella sp.]